MYRLLAAVFAVAVTALPVRADLIWSYTGEGFGPTPAYADSVPFQSDSPSGGVILDPVSSANVSGSAQIVATALRAGVGGNDPSPHGYLPGLNNYTVDLHLTDAASGASGVLHFTGLFTGTITQTKVDVQNTFTGLTTQSLLLGQNRYTVTIGPYKVPDPPGIIDNGSIGAFVDVQPSSPATAPEPSSLVLAALGLAGLGGAAWRHWRRQGAPPPLCRLP